MGARQLSLGGIPAAPFPSTRYQGSKAKLLPWIASVLATVEYSSALDLFSGTSCVSHLLKGLGHSVTANDGLKFNYLIAKALVENNTTTLTEREADSLVLQQPTRTYPTFISDTFADLFFTNAENAWLDVVSENIRLMTNQYKQAIAYFALFQSCIIKRPFNLFHRRNLDIRTRDVPRTFGNKTTWETPFATWFRKFVAEANAAVFDNGFDNRANNDDWRNASPEFSLVYIDPPYMSAKGVSVDFLDFYHFLEGLARQEEWPRLVDWKRKHRPITHDRPAWSDPKRIHSEFEAVIRRFEASTLVVSYRTHGIPSPEELIEMLKRYKATVTVARRPHQYVLSPRRGEELLLVGQ